MPHLCRYTRVETSWSKVLTQMMYGQSGDLYDDLDVKFSFKFKPIEQHNYLLDGYSLIEQSLVVYVTAILESITNPDFPSDRDMGINPTCS